MRVEAEGWGERGPRDDLLKFRVRAGFRMTETLMEMLGASAEPHSQKHPLTWGNTG